MPGNTHVIESPRLVQTGRQRRPYKSELEGIVEQSPETELLDHA